MRVRLLDDVRGGQPEDRRVVQDRGPVTGPVKGGELSPAAPPHPPAERLEPARRQPQRCPARRRPRPGMGRAHHHRQGPQATAAHPDRRGEHHPAPRRPRPARPPGAAVEGRRDQRADHPAAPPAAADPHRRGHQRFARRSRPASRPGWPCLSLRSWRSLSMPVPPAGGRHHEQQAGPGGLPSGYARNQKLAINFQK